MTQPATLLLLLYIVFAVRTVSGRRGTRIAVTVVAALLFFVLAPDSWLGFIDPDYPYGPEYAVMDIIAVVASWTGVVLLYTPGSNAYFRADLHRPS
ncbi:MAG TPA: hypothetical protein VGP70_14305 [Actinomadura sp.]|nr:hypothetical protein [Actinomadura sp.]